ncbi:MAG: hypothetical protein JWP31_182 [Aeromicrobium sp.]|nr:hypothetical protein [Aeromicrobium sp.]
MTESPIPDVSGCTLYLPGHSIHWIQARLTWNEPQPHTPIEIVDVGPDGFVVAVDEGLSRLQNHDLDRLRAIVAQLGPLGALVGYGALQLGGGHLVCVKSAPDGPLGQCSGRAAAEPD